MLEDSKRHHLNINVSKYVIFDRPVCLYGFQMRLTGKHLNDFRWQLEYQQKCDAWSKPQQTIFKPNRLSYISSTCVSIKPWFSKK